MYSGQNTCNIIKRPERLVVLIGLVYCCIFLLVHLFVFRVLIYCRTISSDMSWNKNTCQSKSDAKWKNAPIQEITGMEILTIPISVYLYVVERNDSLTGEKLE